MLKRTASLRRFFWITGLRSTVGNVSGNKCESACRSSGHDPGPVSYFRGDWSWNNFYGHSPPFRWIIQEGLLPVTSTKYVHEVLVKLAQEKTIRRKARKQTNNMFWLRKKTRDYVYLLWVLKRIGSFEHQQHVSHSGWEKRPIINLEAV